MNQIGTNHTDMIEIDGSIGEGGGQVLRTSLSLSLITSQAIKIWKIRAGRKPAGLRPQHLKSVQAVKEISGGTVSGAEIGSTLVEFTPGSVKPGKYTFDISTAGSTSLLLQAIFLPLSLVDGHSKITIYGGTHVPWSPCFHYLAWHWLPYLSQMGFNHEISLDLAGYYPKGGGKISVDIFPHEKLIPINLVHRGKVKEIRGVSAVSNLPRKIAERQRNQVLKRLGSRYPLNDIRIKDLPSNYKGTLLLLLVSCEYSRACFFGLGELGKPAEQVADEAVDSMLAYLDTDGAIDPYLADQLLLPLAVIKEPSKLSTSKVTSHLFTNARIIQRFLPVDIRIDGEIGFPGLILIEPRHFLNHGVNYV